MDACLTHCYETCDLNSYTFLVVPSIINVIFKMCCSMQQHALKSVNNCLNTNIYSYLETSGGQSSNLYLNVDRFFNTGVN